jgi:hypothetical protein
MSEGPEPTAAGPEEPRWAATTWQPAADVEPLPVQRHVLDPLVPGWGVDEPHLSLSPAQDPAAVEHVAPMTPDVLEGEAPTEETTNDDAVAAEAPAEPDRTMLWVVLGALLVAALVFLAIVVGQNLVTGSVQQQVDQIAGAKVSAELTAAGRAMDLYRASTGAYPTDIASLGTVGYTPQDGITIQVVPTVGADYCLAGGPSGEAPTSWYSGATGPTHTPCA